MSEIEKYKKYLNFKANPRYLRRDFIVPLYTGTEPDIVPETSVEQQGAVQEFNDGGRVERQGYSYAGLVTDYINKKKNKTVTSGELLTFLEKNKVKDPSKILYKVLNNPSFIEQGFNVVRTGAREEKKYRKQSSFSKSELNKASQYFFNKNFDDLTDKKQRDKITSRVSRQEGVFRKKTMFDQFSETDQKKILKQFPDAVFKEGQSYGFERTDPRYDEVYRFVSRGFKMRSFKPLPKTVQNDIKANFSEVPENDWNFKLYKYGLSETSGKNRNIGKRIQTFVKDPSTKEFRYGFGFGSPDGWMIAQMDRAYLNGDENYKPLYQNKKIVGFQDNTEKGGGKKYYHKNYKGPLGKEKILITVHPDYKKVSKFVDVAKNAKTDIPEALAKLLPEGYDTSKLKFNDFLNFMLDDKKTDIKTLRNAIEIHHAKGLSSPTSDLQLLTRTANVLARDVEQQILKGDLSNVNKLKEEGIRLVVEGKSYGAGKETAEKGASRIQQQVINYFVNNKEELDKFINMLGCGQKIKAMGLGGRVKFSNGSNCYAKGLEKIQSGELTPGERMIAGNFLKEAGAGENIIKGIISGTKVGMKGLQEILLGTGVVGGLTGAALTIPFAGAESMRGSPGGFGRELIASAVENLNIIPGIDIDAKKFAGAQVTQALERSERPGSQKAASYLFPIQETSREIDKLISKRDSLLELQNNPSIETPYVSPEMIKDIEKQISDKKLTLQEQINNFGKNVTKQDFNDVNEDIKGLMLQALIKGKKISDLLISNTADPEIKKYVQENPNRIILNAQTIPTFINNIKNEFGESANPFIDQLTRKFEDLKVLGKQGQEETGILTPSNYIDVTDIFNQYLNSSYKPSSSTFNYEGANNIENMGREGAAEGGRIGFGKGGMSKRGFLKLLGGTAATGAIAPDLVKALKGGKTVTQVASKIKFEKAQGMYPWFPDLVEKIKVKGKPYEEPYYLKGEASYKHEAKGYGGLPKNVEKLTHYIDGDTEFVLREYPDGRIAVDIHSPRNQEGIDFPVTLYYRPTMELKYYNGVKVEPAEFKVLEKEPKYFAQGPDDVDIEMSEIPKTPGRQTIYGDVEAAERFATGNIKNRKIIPAKQARRDQMEDAPVDFIEETTNYGPVYD